MVFTEPVFLYIFLPFLLLLYFVIPSGGRNILLLFASLLFYAAGERGFVLVLIACITVNYLAGLVVGAGNNRSSKAALVTGITANLAILAFFKYSGFFSENASSLLHALGLNSLTAASVHMPLGISFFTFQAMTYLVDVYRREAHVQKNPFNVALYISLFPQLVAGPIVRYGAIATQLAERRITREGFAEGVSRFIIGLGKKRIIADTLAGPVDLIFAISPGQLTTAAAWTGAVFYTLQIYFDFSGYTDMAIGLGKMFGFRFPENFNYPYAARSVREFWRRWHMTLSNWFRDYLYIPLGGGRRASGRVYFNLLVVFLLCGLWHSAQWKFVFWGFFHGTFIILERGGLGSLLKRVPRLFSHIYLLLVVCAGWVFFRADTMQHAGAFLSAMAGFSSTPAGLSPLSFSTGADVLLVFIAGVIGSAPVMPAVASLFNNRSNFVGASFSWVRTFVLLAIALTCAALTAAGTYNPFIYFRF